MAMISEAADGDTIGGQVTGNNSLICASCTAPNTTTTPPDSGAAPIGTDSADTHTNIVATTNTLTPLSPLPPPPPLTSTSLPTSTSTPSIFTSTATATTTIPPPSTTASSTTSTTSSGARLPGPSLLTQALATARGIPAAAHSKTNPNKQQQPTAVDKVAVASHSEHGDSPLQPSIPTMASTATVTTMMHTLPVRDVTNSGGHEIIHDTMLHHHHHHHHNAVRPFNNNNNNMDGDLDHHHPHYYFDAPLDPHVTEPDPLDSRPRISRFTVGPEVTEKVWSIGAGEGSDEDGLVEKSVAEAMAGVEPNARSRKASYSLRFFKEGLPHEDKPRRKDTKQTPLPSTTEDEQQVIEDTTDTVTPKMQPVHTPGEHSSGATTPSTSTAATAHSDIDYFNLDTRPSLPVASPQEIDLEVTAVSPIKNPETTTTTTVVDVPQSPDKSPEKQPDSSDSQDSGDADADESGEEKISSAVFLPHQESRIVVPEVETPDIAAAHVPTTSSVSQAKPHPWLVKADEPEPECEDNNAEDLTKEVPATKQIEQPSSSDVAFEVKHHVGSNASRASVKQYEDHAHDHQHYPKEPLEAIELIPYKHQVGGHTTLWRFSRRAVCKQLNNRENEFYETIERYHRDLLPFLPRYVYFYNSFFINLSFFIFISLFLCFCFTLLSFLSVI